MFKANKNNVIISCVRKEVVDEVWATPAMTIAKKAASRHKLQSTGMEFLKRIVAEIPWCPGGFLCSRNLI